MRARYRYVPYGTNFEPVKGARPSGERRPQLLYENEIAADVGGIFWRHAGSLDSPRLPIIDHHFAREAQFPSASAAVLHSAAEVHRWWADRRGHSADVWLVTHEFPDFDAFASLYLILSLKDWHRIDPAALGMASDSWRDMTEAEVRPKGSCRIDWFASPKATLEDEVRWRIALAVVASMSDGCRRFGCHKTQSSPAVLYAALMRGRPFELTGGDVFFEHFRDAIVKRGKNPLMDAIFEGDPEFAPEVELLRRDLPAYQRDVMRGRRAIVTIPTYSGAFQPYYDALIEQPLLTDGLEIHHAHLETTGAPSSVDGIYIRDPESLLFKDLARMDSENSSMGQGFLFTAVAYSNGRPEALHNRTEYYFALDPERAGKRTLYPLWAELEAAEIRRMGPVLRQHLAALEPRDGFAKRAGELGGLMKDPWFDGSNYRTSLVATPHQGTLIGPAGTSPDLSDDPVASTVAETLENGAYGPDLHGWDFSDEAGGKPYSSPVNARTPLPLLKRGFRLCLVPLVDGLSLAPPLQREQIGAKLWGFLHTPGTLTPKDFSDRHLTHGDGLVAVWSRRGVAVAYLPGAIDHVRQIEGDFAALIALLFKIKKCIAHPELEQADQLMRDLSAWRQELSLQHQLLAFRRFVEALEYHESLATLRGLLASREDKEIARVTGDSIEAMKKGQERVDLFEILFVSLYSIELINILLERLAKVPEEINELRLLCGLGIVFALAAWWGLSRNENSTRKEGKPRSWNPIVAIPILTIALMLAALAATCQPMLGWYQQFLHKSRQEGSAAAEAKDKSSTAKE
jgi:hypothetical protein